MIPVNLDKRKKIFLSIFIIIILVMFVVFPVYVAYASLHPPRCEATTKPSDFGLNFRNVEVTTEDGLVLRGWVIDPPVEERDTILVIMHGYTSCKSEEDLVSVATEFAKTGYRVVMFDFRGHGESDGDTTTIGPLEAEYDAKAIVSFVAEEYPGRPIALLGYSMGGVVAIVAGSQIEEVDVIIADSPYPVLGEVVPRWLKAKMGIPTWYSKIIGFYGSIIGGASLDFGPLTLESIDKPLLVIVGTEDPLVTPDEAREMADKSPNGIAVIVDGAGHVEAAFKMGLEEYVNTIDNFITGNIESTLLHAFSYNPEFILAPYTG